MKEKYHQIVFRVPASAHKELKKELHKRRADGELIQIPQICSEIVREWAKSQKEKE